MQTLIQKEYDLLPQKYKEFIQSRMFPLKKMVLEWDYSKGKLESYEGWAFAEISEFKDNRFVGAAYCKGGFGEMGAPWGLIWLNEEVGSFGMDTGWFRNLKDLLEEWL